MMDVKGLVEAVAKVAWDTDIHDKPITEVYDIWVDTLGESHQEVNEEYTRKFWYYVHVYSELAKSYVKPKEDEPNKTEQGARPEGADLQ